MSNFIETCADVLIDLGVKVYILFVDNSNQSLLIKSSLHGILINFIFPWEELFTKAILTISIGTISYLTQILLATLIPYQKIRNYLDKKMSRKQEDEPNINK